jgi:hypothetical protein
VLLRVGLLALDGRSAKLAGNLSSGPILSGLSRTPGNLQVCIAQVTQLYHKKKQVKKYHVLKSRMFILEDSRLRRLELRNPSRSPKKKIIAIFINYIFSLPYSFRKYLIY